MKLHLATTFIDLHILEILQGEQKDSNRISRVVTITERINRPTDEVLSAIDTVTVTNTTLLESGSDVKRT